jgi:hypothetical protein
MDERKLVCGFFLDELCVSLSKSLTPQKESAFPLFIYIYIYFKERTGG